jgi:hypothetical protein
VAADDDAYDLYMEEVAAVMALMDSLRDSVGVDYQAVRVGPWLVYAPDHNGSGYPLSLVIVPNPTARAEDILFGITAGVLQKLRIADLRERYREQVEPMLVAREWLVRFMNAAGNKRRDDRFYAVASAAYARLTEAGETAPLRTMAEMAGLPVGTVRTQIREARRRGMLTGVHGRAGGNLTERAAELIGEPS